MSAVDNVVPQTGAPVQQIISPLVGDANPEGVINAITKIKPKVSFNEVLDVQAVNGVPPTNVETVVEGFTVFGFELSKKTVYFAIVLLVIIIGYFVYKQFFSSSESNTKNKKRRSKDKEVSFKQQAKLDKKLKEEKQKEEVPEEQDDDDDEEEE
jgi:hypothetical protein